VQSERLQPHAALQPMSETARCRHCGEVIGVYEPLVRLLDGQAHATSRVLEPDIAERAGICYHRACYERLCDDEPLTG
jgi:hypothetical protein